jgi:tRNA pseudouridine65 synthase
VNTPPFTLLHRDDRLAVICKPAGWLVHATALDRGETRVVLQALRKLLGQTVFPLHRLDKATSGVLAFALDSSTARSLGERFESGEGIRKTYRAIVRGWPTGDRQIDHPLTRMKDDRTDSRTQSLPAQTLLRILHRGALPVAHGPYPEIRHAELELRPLTGRRHQIRRHLKHIAHPVIGDSTHGKGPLNRAVSEHLGIARLWLHAESLELVMPGAHECLRFVAPTGPEWQAWRKTPASSAQTVPV